MTMGKLAPLALLMCACISSNIQASSEEDVLKVKNTTLKLIEALVNEGVITQQRADELVSEAEREAKAKIELEEREQSQPPEKVIRVPYVPDFVKDQIREEVKSELREDVVDAVMTQAKTERWGVPGTTPEWTSRIKVSGDIRLRAEGEMYGDDNEELDLLYFDFADINDGGNGNINLVEDRQRMRLRARLKIAAKIVQGLKAEFRLATGSTSNPVSLNESLGDYFVSDSIILDRAYLQYDKNDFEGFNWLTLAGGRMPNPHFSTDLVWDSDVNFEGVASTFRLDISGGEDDVFAADEQNRTMYFTLGAFPVQEIELSEKDKWLFSAQIGALFISDSQSEFEVAISYYDYHNIEGKRNSQGSDVFDYTAPDFMQGGNSLFEISNPVDPNDPPSKFGLVSDYDLLNVTLRYDIAHFSPMHLILTADYVKNIGYDADAAEKRAEGSSIFLNSSAKFTAAGEEQDEQTEGYHVEVAYGWPNVTARGNWQVAFGYKYLERDAVLDAFTDSNFFAFGTNAKGWRLMGSYGINENFWLSAKYQSSQAIDGFDEASDLGLDLSYDLIQIDLNAKF